MILKILHLFVDLIVAYIVEYGAGIFLIPKQKLRIVSYLR